MGVYPTFAYMTSYGKPKPVHLILGVSQNHEYPLGPPVMRIIL